MQRNNYPKYAGFTPEQRWTYLKWLENPQEIIDIGYVFVFYYGLERQLLTGDFDKAFDMLLDLRKHHSNDAFQNYSAHALIYSTIIRDRVDRLSDLFNLLENPRWGNAELLVAYKSQPYMSAQDLIKIIGSLPAANKRYMKTARQVYYNAVVEALREKYAKECFPFREIADIAQVPRKPVLAFGNISLPERVRSVDIPDFMSYEPFSAAILGIAGIAHEATKNELRRQRTKPG